MFAKSTSRWQKDEDRIRLGDPPSRLRAVNVLNLKDWGRVAQLVEQCPFKAWVAGSSPAALTMIPQQSL
jgi:hypothetical protein